MKIANDALIRDYDIYDKPYIILFDEAIEDAKLIGPLPEEKVDDDYPFSDADSTPDLASAPTLDAAPAPDTDTNPNDLPF